MSIPEVVPGELELPYCSFEELERRLRAAEVWGTFTVNAINQAVISHSSKTRDSGHPYLEEHVFPVTVDVLDYLTERGAPVLTKEFMTTGTLLHDTVEDDPDFDLEKCEERFGLSVTRLVYPLTKIGTDHDIYIKKLENASEEAKIIKIIDRLNNLYCSVVLAREKPGKLVTYLFDTETNYLPLADLLLDKSLYRRMSQLIDLGHSALESPGESI